MRRAIQTAAALFLLASSAFAVEPVDRLAHVGKLWGMVRYLHPWVAYKDVDWDAALVAAIPRVREAKTSEEYKAAVQGMLDALGDPLTRVTDPPPPPPAEPAQKVELTRQLDGGVVVVDLAGYLKNANRREAFGLANEVPEEVAKASMLVFDLRSGESVMGAFFSQLVLEAFGNALVSRPVQAPAQRYLLHSGYQPQAGGGSRPVL